MKLFRGRNDGVLKITENNHKKTQHYMRSQFALCKFFFNQMNFAQLYFPDEKKIVLKLISINRSSFLYNPSRIIS